MGKYYSSLTRVKPVFDQMLCGGCGPAWIGDLVKLPERTDGRAPLPADPGPLAMNRSPYEYPALPSREYLAWLLEHLSPDKRPSQEYWRHLSVVTRDKREKLLAHDPDTVAKACAELSRWPNLPETAWWLLEGRSKIDCALLTDKMVLFIEGKRTEMGPSEATVWASGRNQVLRNLDCARALARHTGRPYYFSMLVVEEYGARSDDERRAEHHGRVTAPETVEWSLPHLSKSERAEVLTHYLGVTTWQRIAARFGLQLRPK